MGEKLRAARRRANRSIASIAELCGYSTNHVSLVERGLRPPPPPGHPLYRVAGELLGVDAKSLERRGRREREQTILMGVPWRKRPA